MKKFRYYLLLDVLFILCLILFFNVLIQKHSYQYDILNIFSDSMSFLAWAWKVSPIIASYLLLRVFKISPLIVFTIVGSILMILYTINKKKLLFLDTPISFSDLYEVRNFSVAYKYIEYQEYVYFLLFLIFFVVLIIVFCKFVKFFSKQPNVYTLFLIILFIPIVYIGFFPVMKGIQSFESINKILSRYQSTLGLTYVNWSWKRNFENVGLPYHLVQTSLRKVPPTATIHERENFDQLIAKTKLDNPSNSPKNIIFILCESCWFDDTYFKDIFQPIVGQGFREFRGVSPVVGGGTANSEFEVLTGLPSNNNYLSGIIFQEYAVSVVDQSKAYPQFLKKMGYMTYAAHNNDKSFYHRQNILPKLGLDEYHGIEDMEMPPSNISEMRYAWQWQHDDWSLYNSALQYLNKNLDHYNFMHLLTMSLHGPYHIQYNDDGETQYQIQATETVDRLLGFLQHLEEKFPDSIIVIYGDHKPKLNDFFVKNEIFPSNLETLSYSDRMKIMGDVPIFIKGSDDQQVSRFVQLMNGKPLFCLPVIFDSVFTAQNFPLTLYAIERCSQSIYDYEQLSKSYESWLYSLMLFEE